jgi:hypothetical protein
MLSTKPIQNDCQTKTCGSIKEQCWQWEDIESCKFWLFIYLKQESDALVATEKEVPVSEMNAFHVAPS